MKMPFEIGDVYWAPQTTSKKVRRPCPVCAGTGIVVVLYGDEERVSVDCEACGLGFERARGFVEEWEFEPSAERFVVVALESMHDGHYRLRGEDRSTVEFDVLQKTEAEALAVSKALCAAQHERNMQSHLHARNAAKRTTWSAHYHKKCIAELERQIAWHTARINAKKKEQQS